MTPGIGHNRPPETFDDVAREGVDYGILLRIKEVIVEASRDPRLERRHLRVLAEVVACLNSQTGIAYPGRATISAATRKWNPTDGGDEEYGYTDAGVSKTLSELVTWGYLVTIRRALEKGGRALTLYAIRKPPQEDLAEHITQWVMAQRMSAPPKRNWRLPTRPDTTLARNSTHAGVSTDAGKPTHVGGVRASEIQKSAYPAAQHTTASGPGDPVSTYVGNSTHVDRQAPDSTSDSTYVVPTVTVGETSERTEEGAGAPPKVYARPGEGETHLGYGVYLNCHHIRHSSFSINLDGIRMQSLNSGMSANEITDFCLGHALQWATEIENGTLPEKVIPSKVANFLASSIMSAVNQRKIQRVREDRAAQPYAPRVAAASDAPVESRADRLRRESKERAEQRARQNGGDL